jgi:hypothetical protein
MPDVVISRVNALGSDQPCQMTFTDRHGRLIGDIEILGVDANEEQEGHFPGVEKVIVDDIEMPGVDMTGPEALDKATAPQVEINDLDIPQEDPAPIEVSPPQESAAPAMPTPVVTTAHAPGLCRSTQVTTQAKQAYTPSMTGSKYYYAVTQLETERAQYRCAYVCAKGFLSSRSRRCGSHYDTTLTQGRSEGMG